ncbi:MAG TPA: hypothetical protein VHY20_14750, partial [Pirellulales bacterium]|nr:hypothetical protein [Pirellulales bacterium]
MPGLPRWFRRASQRPARNERRNQSARSRLRSLRMEWLEDRRLLTYTVSELGSAGSETLLVAKAASDTANLSITADAGGDVTIADPGIAFTAGSLAGVTFNANSIVLDPAAAGVVHLQFDFTADNGQTNLLTVGELNDATIPGFDVLPSAATIVALATAEINTGSSTAANASINLGGSLVVLDAPAVAIKTAQLGTDVPGNVVLGSVTAAAEGGNLSIDTSSATTGVNGGSVTLASLDNDQQQGLVIGSGGAVINGQTYNAGDILAVNPLETFVSASAAPAPPTAQRAVAGQASSGEGTLEIGGGTLEIGGGTQLQLPEQT